MKLRARLILGCAFATLLFSRVNAQMFVGGFWLGPEIDVRESGSTYRVTFDATGMSPTLAALFSPTIYVPLTTDKGVFIRRVVVKVKADGLPVFGGVNAIRERGLSGEPLVLGDVVVHSTVSVFRQDSRLEDRPATARRSEKAVDRDRLLADSMVDFRLASPSQPEASEIRRLRERVATSTGASTAAVNAVTERFEARRPAITPRAAPSPAVSRR